MRRAAVISQIRSRAAFARGSLMPHGPVRHHDQMCGVARVALHALDDNAHAPLTAIRSRCVLRAQSAYVCVQFRAGSNLHSALALVHTLVARFRVRPRLSLRLDLLALRCTSRSDYCAYAESAVMRARSGHARSRSLESACL